jgi:hypothetical protein
MGYEAKCKGCGKPIVWADSKKKDGTIGRMSFDPDPVENGTHSLVHPRGDKTKLVATYIEKGGEWPTGSLPRIPHYKTCTAPRKPAA